MLGNLNLMEILIRVPITLLALSVHELAHGWVSYKLGDPTPKNQGRLTLNPFAHLDLIGTLLMIFTRFGWAKPVQINPMYYRDRVKGMAITAAAGPISNFILAFLGMFIGSILMLVFGYNIEAVAWIKFITEIFVLQNLCFMIFNFIPFPPLDGFKIFGMFMPRSTYYKILQYEQYIMYLLMLLCLTGAFSNIIGIGVNFFYRIIQIVVGFIVGLFI